jgi:hypothetical protein
MGHSIQSPVKVLVHIGDHKTWTGRGVSTRYVAGNGETMRMTGIDPGALGWQD